MANTPGTSLLRIERDNHFEDYRSLKQCYRNKICNEIIWAGHQLTTNAFVELGWGDETPAYPAANDIVYIKSEADLAALDGVSIWIDYVNSLGVIYEAILSLLDDQRGTDNEVPISGEAGTKYDTISAVAGDTVTMTNLNSAVANDLAGEYIVSQGDATHREGEYLTILSNTAASPTVITCTTTPNADWADDKVSIQAVLSNDVYRIRRMWVETESPADNKQYVCDFNGGNIFAVVQDAGSRSNQSRYFAPTRYAKVGGVADTVNRIDSYFGKIHASFPSVQADAEIESAQVQITLTPAPIDSNEISGVPSDVTFEFYVHGEFNWEPCIKLARNTDVIIKVQKPLNADHAEIFVDYSILEVTTI